MTKENVEHILDLLEVKNYIIHDDLSVSVNGDVELSHGEWTELPIKFKEVTGYFNCSHHELTTLENCPKKVGKYFSCSYNYLTDLKGCPEYVGGDFYCTSNKITTLEFSPIEVGDAFICAYNDIYNFDKFDCKFDWLDFSFNPLASFDFKFSYDFYHAFKTFKIINDKEVNFKRLKYVMDIFDKFVNLDEIRKYYTLV